MTDTLRALIAKYDDDALALRIDKTAGNEPAARTYDAMVGTNPITEATYAYDSLGNLASETLDPRASPAKSVSYDWAWFTSTDGLMSNRLQSTTYPSAGRTFDYTYDAGVRNTSYEQIGRMTGLARQQTRPSWLRLDPYLPNTLSCPWRSICP